MLSLSLNTIPYGSQYFCVQVLHYAQELFEGMKAYRGVDGKIRLFRPMHNMARMNLTASRACLPAFDGYQLLECIRKYVVLNIILSYNKFYDEYHIIL